MTTGSQTFVGTVASVTGAVVTVRLREDMPSTLLLVDGESYRVGQIGGFSRIPLGYTSLYAVCTQIGAAAAPSLNNSSNEPPNQANDRIDNRWMTVTLFGESTGQRFERGVSQYPTVGDTVHLVTPHDMRTIYGDGASEDSLIVGEIAAAAGIAARLKLSPLIARHFSIVGSTGSGKSNTVAVVLEAIATGPFSSARTTVIDPHGEYAAAVGDSGYAFRINTGPGPRDDSLNIPFWALPFSELRALLLGDLQPVAEAAVRDELLKLKVEAATKLPEPIAANLITADSPIPFSIRQLWFILDDYERQTFADTA
ncbi:MAG: ATP-binding protein, partial [Nitrospiraceae bacterium]|nr:ATP-binding protein [Nitrospiraceae bacterium]